MRNVLLVFLSALCISFPLHSGADAGPLRLGSEEEKGIVTSIAFTPDGKTLLFARQDGDWGVQPRPKSAIFLSRKLDNGEWAEPVPAPFSGQHDDDDPFVSLDGKYVYFVSTRPSPDKQEPDPDIWRVAITKEGFGAPERLPEPVNSPGVEYSPVTVANGALYFASTREGGLGQGDLYRAAATDAEFATPENLGPSVNSRRGEWNLYVTPAEDLLIFEGSGRADNVGNGSGDLYAALKVDGEWALTRNLKNINSTGSDLNLRMFPHAPGEIHYAGTVADHRPKLVSRPLTRLLANFDRLFVVARSTHEVCTVTVPAFFPSGCDEIFGNGPRKIAVTDGLLLDTAYVTGYGVFPERHHPLIEEEKVKWRQKNGANIFGLDVEHVSVFYHRNLLAGCGRPYDVATYGERLWVSCEDSGQVREMKVPDENHDDFVRIWKLGKGVRELALAPDGKILAVASIAGTVTLIDFQAERLTAMQVGARPAGLAFAPDGKKLFVLNALSDTISVINMAARKVIETAPTGGRYPVGIAVAAGAKEIWVSHNKSKDLTVLDQDTLQKKERVQMRWRPLTLILSDDEQWAFVTVPRRNEVWAYDTATRERRAVIPDMMEADGLAFVPAR